MSDRQTFPERFTAREPVALDHLASLARTALDDPNGLPEAPRPWTGPSDDPTAYYGQGYSLYAIDRMDEIIDALNPALETRETFAASLTALGLHLADRADRMDSIALDDGEPYAEAAGLVHAALDRLDEAIALLAPESDDATLAPAEDPIWDHRVTASDWHGGQSSPLYALSSTGTPVVGLAAEVRSCIRGLTAPSTERLTADAELPRLRALLAWAETNEPDGEES